MRRLRGRLLGLILGTVILASTIAGVMMFVRPKPSPRGGEILALKPIGSISDILSVVEEVDVTYHGTLNDTELTILASYKVVFENETHILALFSSQQENTTTTFEVAFSKEYWTPLYIKFENGSIEDPQLASMYLSRIVGLQFTPLSLAWMYYNVLKGSRSDSVRLKLISEGELEFNAEKCKTWTYQVFEESSKEIAEYKITLGDYEGYLVAFSASVKFTDSSEFNFKLSNLKFKG